MKEENIIHMGPSGPYRIKGHIFIAKVKWSRITGGAMWDMDDEEHIDEVARCNTYEDAIEAALPYCREKTKFMLTQYTEGTHAEIIVEHKVETESIEYPALPDSMKIWSMTEESAKNIGRLMGGGKDGGDEDQK